MSEQLPTPDLTAWVEVWRRTRDLTYDLLHALPYAVMNFSPHPDFGTFIRQIRHVGDIQACYTEAIKSGTMDFAAQPRQRALERSKEHLEAYLRRLDEELFALLGAMTDDQRRRVIAWGQARAPLLQHLMWLLQHETLHHGMWAFYAKIAELPLPDSWRQAWTLT